MVRQVLRVESPANMSRPMMQKNSLHQLGNFHLLSEDQFFVLRKLDECLSQIKLYPEDKVLITIKIFGQNSKAKLMVDQVAADHPSVPCLCTAASFQKLFARTSSGLATVSSKWQGPEDTKGVPSFNLDLTGSRCS